MEHIVQFGISIDDRYIKRRVEEEGYKDIINAIRDKIYSEINHKFICDENYLKQFLEENKEIIIERAVNNITSSIKNSKRYREALADVVEKIVGK